MVGIVNRERERVIQNRTAFLETDFVLPIVRFRLLFIPLKAQFQGDPLRAIVYHDCEEYEGVTNLLRRKIPVNWIIISLSGIIDG